MLVSYTISHIYINIHDEFLLSNKAYLQKYDWDRQQTTESDRRKSQTTGITRKKVYSKKHKKVAFKKEEIY